MATANPIVAKLQTDPTKAEALELLLQSLSPSELQSVLLEAFRQRTSQLAPADLLRQYETHHLLGVSEYPVNWYRELTQLAAACLPESFEEVELSPVTALGAASVLGPVDQNKVLSTIRGVEVISDSTNALALECAGRRKQCKAKHPQSPEVVSLAADHRFLRTQRQGIPGPSNHLRMFALVSAGRARAERDFEYEQLTEHLKCYLDFLTRWREQKRFEDFRVAVHITSRDEAFSHSEIQRRVAAPLERPQVRWRIRPRAKDGKTYYRSLDFKVSVTRRGDVSLAPISGGFLDWTAQLLNDRKERFLASGIDGDACCRFMSACARRRL